MLAWVDGYVRARGSLFAARGISMSVRLRSGRTFKLNANVQYPCTLNSNGWLRSRDESNCTTTKPTNNNSSK